MIPITVLDNFYENPEDIRRYALQNVFSKGPNSNFPGKRTGMIGDINPRFYFQFKEKLCNLLFKNKTVDLDILTYFQSIPSYYEEGWIHKDHGTSFAGVVYLTPNAPLNCGTALYKEKNVNEEYDFSKRDSFYSDQVVDMDNYRAIRNLHNSKFEKTLEINNVFNRVIVYDGSYFHRECGFFGNDKFTNRLTQVFFARLKE